MTLQSRFNKEYDKFLEVLITARMSQGFLQDELATALGKPEGYVQDYEKKTVLLNIIEYLEISDFLRKEPLKLLKNLGII